MAFGSNIVTAVDFIASKSAGSRAPSEQDLATDDPLWNKLKLDSSDLDLFIEGALTSGEMERTIEGASTITLTVNDKDRVLSKSKIFNNPIQIKLPFKGEQTPTKNLTWGKKSKPDKELIFQLVKIRRVASTITLVFEDFAVWCLRQHKSFKKATRGHMTRAEFIYSLVREVKAIQIKFYANELRKKQPIATAKVRKKDNNDEDRDPGFGSGANIEVKGHDATPDQKKNIARVLDVGYSQNRSTRLMTAAIMTITEESVAENLVGGDQDSRGLFQQQKYINGKRTQWPASRDIEKDATGFYEVAARVDKQYPGIPLYELCWRVQANFDKATKGRATYGRWQAEAKRTVGKYMGTDAGLDTVQEPEPYEFRRGEPGEPEDSWKCGQRLAGQVNWRLFMSNGVLYYMSETDLYRIKPKMTFNEDTPGIMWIDCDRDQGKAADEVTISARASAWLAPPGTTIEIKDNDSLTDGKWLVTSIRRDLFSPKTTITARKPIREKSEPAPQMTSVESEGGDPQFEAGTDTIRGGTVRERIVAAAKRALSNLDDYQYGQTRPMPSTLFPQGDTFSNPLSGKPNSKIVTDCSGFVTLCYKAARAEDPNGLNYNGSGYTGTLKANGRITKKPQPGDLVFYGNPEHVNLYIGNGEIIGFGGNPIKRYKVKDRWDFEEFRTYID